MQKSIRYLVRNVFFLILALIVVTAFGVNWIKSRSTRAEIPWSGRGGFDYWPSEKGVPDQEKTR